jgi:hypothetical protein
LHERAPFLRYTYIAGHFNVLFYFQINNDRIEVFVFITVAQSVVL